MPSSTQCCGKGGSYTKDRLEHARGWFRKADSDLATAKRTLASEGPYDTACFHAHQAAEKYLKGFLALSGKDIPRTHDLEELQALCLAIDPHLGIERLELEQLSSYAVDARYDLEFWPGPEVAAEAVSLAEQIRSVILAATPASVRPEEPKRQEPPEKAEAPHS